MPKRSIPEFHWSESRQQYRKRIPNPLTGGWTDVWGKTKPECRQRAEERADELARAQESIENPYVYEYAAKWYSLNTKSLKAKRRGDYANAINNHICPVIGKKRVSEVKHDDILEVMTAAAHLSESSQQKIVTTLKRIFAAAALNKIIEESPCGDLKAGGAKSKEKVPLTREQQKRLLEAVDGTRADIFVRLCLFAGLRREEALGLCWDCVHLDTNPPYISVRRSVGWEGKNQATLFEELKSDAASRDIPIPDQIFSRLKKLKESSTSDYVIPNSKGEAVSSASFRRLWDVVKNRTVRDIKVKEGEKTVTKRLALGDKVRNHNVTITLDFPVTPHQLRHTYITELILSGANVKTVQYLAGHASPVVTLRIYTHLMENRPAQTASAVRGAFGGLTGGQADLKKTGKREKQREK